MSFKVIEGDGPGKEERDKERQREWATSEFSWAIRETAANMLRIIRGAGKPYQLLMQMKKTIDSAINFQELHGYWPNDVMANKLRLQDEVDDCLEPAATPAHSRRNISIVGRKTARLSKFGRTYIVPRRVAEAKAETKITDDRISAYSHGAHKFFEL